MADVFDLRWNDFDSNASKVFTSQRDKSSFCDVSLVSDDLKQHSAHKIILSACSEYFNTVLSSCDTPHTLVCMPGLSDEELAQMLDYIYKGEAQVQKNKIDRFLNIAQRFKLAGLLPKKDTVSLKSEEAEELIEEAEAVPVHNVEHEYNQENADDDFLLRKTKGDENVFDLFSSLIDEEFTETEEETVEKSELSSVENLSKILKIKTREKIAENSSQSRENDGGRVKKRKRDTRRVVKIEPMIKEETGADIDEYVLINEDGTFSCKICGQLEKSGNAYKTYKTRTAQWTHIEKYHNNRMRGRGMNETK